MQQKDYKFGGKCMFAIANKIGLQDTQRDTF